MYTFFKNNICSAGYSSVCEHFPSIHKALISIPNNINTNKIKTIIAYNCLTKCQVLPQIFFLSCSNRSPWWRLRIHVSHFSVVPEWALIRCYSSWNSCVVKVVRETMPDEDSGQDKGWRIISTCEFVPNIQNCRNQTSFNLKTPPNMKLQWRVNTINAHNVF